MKITVGVIKKMFIRLLSFSRLLTSIVKASDYTNSSSAWLKLL